MDRGVIGGLINSISRLIHLVSCQTSKTIVLRDFRNIVATLKQVKPILDEAYDSSFPISEQLIKAFAELDAAVNEAREFMERWPQRMSKIYSVLQSGSLLLNIHSSSMSICQVLNKLLLSSSFTSFLADIQLCIQELRCAQHDPMSNLIEKALDDLKGNHVPDQEDIIKIVDSLGLTSNMELLMENIALEKERLKVEVKNNDADLISRLIILFNQISNCVEELEKFGFINGVPIPSHFQCPLSLQLLRDPVIVASGQTYERSFIQKWLNSGLRVCPKTRENLVHTGLISNYAVKALIESWCQENKLNPYNAVCLDKITNPQKVLPGNAIHISLQRDSARGLSTECISQAEEREDEISSDCGGEDPYWVGNPHFIMVHENKVPSRESLEWRSSHSRSESISSVISSISIASRLDEKFHPEGSCATTSPLNAPSISPSISSSLVCGSKSECEHIVRNQSMQSTSEFDDSSASSNIRKLVVDLNSQTPEIQTAAASELRLLTRHNMENRILVARCGAIPPLVSLLSSKVKLVQENAVTALLNLSINDTNKFLIAEAGALDLLIHVLEHGSSEAKENSAATLYSLSSLEEYKAKIGRSRAIKALVNLLGSDSLQGKKDAAAALFNLSIFHDNKVRIVQAGAVKFLVELMEPSTRMVDKAVALLVNLSTVPEGRLAIAQEGGIPLLVEVVETGSQRGKENAASALLHLCIHNSKFCGLVLQEGAVPPLIALSQFGTPRAKEKAQQLLSHFRSQRECIMRKAKS